MISLTFRPTVNHALILITTYCLTILLCSPKLIVVSLLRPNHYNTESNLSWPPHFKTRRLILSLILPSNMLFALTFPMYSLITTIWIVSRPAHWLPKLYWYTFTVVVYKNCQRQNSPCTVWSIILVDAAIFTQAKIRTWLKKLCINGWHHS